VTLSGHPVFCAPGKGVDSVVKVRYGRGSTSPLVKGKGVHREAGSTFQVLRESNLRWLHDRVALIKSAAEGILTRPAAGCREYFPDEVSTDMR